MPKKTLFLIGFLFVITIALFYLALNETQKVELGKNQTTQIATVPTEVPVNKTAELYYSPDALTVNTNIASPSSADIFVNTGVNKITGVQLELSYDPEIITSLQVSQPIDEPFFKQGEFITLISPGDVVDQKNGRASYIVALTPNLDAKTGIGKVATITIRVNPLTTKTQTQINFVDKTMVTELGTIPSVLKKSSPLIINLTK